MPLRLPSQPVTLPTELWEKAFLYLTPEQIVKLRTVLLSFTSPTSASAYLCCLQVNRDFRGLIDGSPGAQYLIDLYAAGLEVGYQDPSLTLANRRKRLDLYRSHWDSLQWVEHTSLPLPFHKYQTVIGGVICLVLFADAGGATTDFHFIQLPSVLRGIPLKEWTLHGLPHDASKPGLLPEEDLLAVCSPVGRGRYVSTSTCTRSCSCSCELGHSR